MHQAHQAHQAHDGECYKWFSAPLDFTAAADKWVVVIGVSQATIDADTELIQVTLNSVVIDGFLLKTFGVAANEAIVGLPRRMLIPPGGILDGTATVIASLVECCCLAYALAIL